MKKLLILLLLIPFLGISQPMRALIAKKASSGSVIPTSGLVREYLLNNGAATETIFGTANGTVTDCTSIAGINGEANGALRFNGTSSKITFASTNSGTPYTNFTISCYINLYRVATTSQYFLAYSSNGVRYNGTTFAIATIDGTTGTLDYTKVDGWIHFAVTRTGASTYNIYINAVLLGTLTATGTGGFPLNMFGARSDGFYSNVDMAKVRIYNRVLSDAELLALKNEKL